MSDDKHLSGEEKRRRMKEQFKKELAERKEFANKVKNLRRLQNINNALDGMKMEDDSQDWIDRLDQETAMNEAKTEMALESAAQAAKDAEAEAEMEAIMQKSEAEMKKLAAEEMVRKMKEEMAREADLHTTGGGSEPVSKGGGLLNVEIGVDGEAVSKEAAERNLEKPARKMMADLSDSGETTEEVEAKAETPSAESEGEVDDAHTEEAPAEGDDPVA